MPVGPTPVASLLLVLLLFNSRLHPYNSGSLDRSSSWALPPVPPRGGGGATGWRPPPLPWQKRSTGCLPS